MNKRMDWLKRVKKESLRYWRIVKNVRNRSPSLNVECCTVDCVQDDLAFDWGNNREMASGFGESTSRQPQNPQFSSNNGNGDAGNFECNICFDLAQDPIVTLCGHLFCWPCLYKWLHFHSQSKECPVCKALVEEEKLVPLYGRGKTSTDPRSKSIPGVNIPNRPLGRGLKQPLHQDQMTLPNMDLDLWEGWEDLHQWQQLDLGILHCLQLLVVSSFTF
ncbi:hypothetical protein GH714_014864 [Hevea brasiliensis]|uniref:E3 ubiquitin-protein ligase RMA n=1 Tax=Hevea brasiliensis TaxID=3981 RepID=A0A6A6NH78_HEVBR|nr:hypothetical protein GH714_014864 [Hevea brasiliensis]